MATNFPTGLDTLTNPQPTDPLNAPSHSDQHININDGMEAVQAKVGIDGSAVVTSLDYLVSNASSVDPGHEHTLAAGANDVTATFTELNQLSGVTVGGTASGDIVTIDGTQTLTNKTIVAANNSISGLQHGVEVDEPSSGVHGVTGSIVGTTDTQTLSGKTIGDTLIFTDDAFANLTMQGTEPATPSTGDVYLDDGSNTLSGDPGLRRYNGATWEDVSGGTVSPLTTKGDIYTYDTDNARLGVGADGTFLKANSATATGLEWGTGSPYTPPVTTKGDLFGYDTGEARVPVGTDGQALIADSTDALGVSWQDVGAQALVENEVPSGTINGTNVTFTLANTPATNSLNLYQNGIRLKPTEDYTITGDTITFVTAPTSGDILLADYSTSTGIYATGSTSFVYNETPTGTIDGANAVFTTANSFVSGSTLVYLDGQLQRPGASYDYQETDVDEITFNTAPVIGSTLLISYQQTVSTVGNADTLDGFNASATPTANTIPVLDGNALLPEAIGAYNASMARQAIINGNFDVWQRGTSFSTANSYTADRWAIQWTNSSTTTTRQAFTIGQTDVPLEPKYYIRNVVTSSAGASNFSQLIQKVESVRSFAGQNVTLSFYAKADAAKDMTVEIYQNFGTGGSPSASNTAMIVDKKTLTTGWVKYTVTGAVDSISGKTLGTSDDGFLGVVFWFDAGSSFDARTNTLGQQSGTFEISQVQLNAGSEALPFEPKSYGQELADCQRYAYTIVNTASEYNFMGGAASTTIAYILARFPVPMRVLPSIDATATDWVVTDFVTGQNVTALGIQNYTRDSMLVRCTVASGLTAFRTYYLIGDGGGTRRFTFDAEL